jgi:hypothetical protein
MPERRSERKGSDQIAGVFLWNRRWDEQFLAGTKF